MITWITELPDTQENKKVQNRKDIILITGAAGKIGFALVEDQLKNGNKVLLGDINKKEQFKIKSKLNSKNLEIFSSD